jgi:putative hydrolase of the HAD superfamily
MVETYGAFAQRQGTTPLLRVEQRIARIATGMVRNNTRPMPRAREVLRALRGRSRLVLLTKGEYAFQERRVAESGFGEFFERVVIVEHKEPETFLRLVREFAAAAKQTWSVGDSLRSDINPAIEAGLNAVWIPQATWDYESAEITDEGSVVRARSIRELPRILRAECKRGPVGIKLRVSFQCRSRSRTRSSARRHVCEQKRCKGLRRIT